jgi:hypothetical protein
MVTTVTVNRTELETKVQDLYRQVALHPEGEFHFRVKSVSLVADKPAER